MIKNLKKMFLISQKKRPGELNAAQKTPALYKVQFLKNPEKTFQKYNFLQNCIFFPF